MNSGYLPLFVALPLGAAFIIPVASLLWKKLAGLLTVAITVILVVIAIGRIGAADVSYSVGGWDPPFGINLVGDALSGLFLLIVAVVSLLIAIYSMVYMKRYTSVPRYFCLLLLMIAGMNGVVVSGDIFNIYVFLEIASFASYALVAFGIDREELEASFKYLVLGGLGSSFLLLGIAFLYSITGSLNLADISKVFSDGLSGPMVQFVAALFFIGFGTKAALVPFHAWLPDAHPSAPAPISAMLSGLLIKTLGAYCIARLFFNVFEFQASFSIILISMGVLSMVIGALLAIGQNDFKRMLAYSSISQMGYIAMALGIASPLAIIGALFHLLNHAFFKTLLFLCSGAIEYATGTRDLRELGGLWKKMPATSATCSIASMSISGIPPLGGFFSKLIIIIATVKAYDTLGPIAYVLAGIAVFVSFLTIVYFAKLQKMSLFGPLPEKLSKVREVPFPMWSVLVVLAVICIAFGVACPWFINALISPAQEVLLDKGAYIFKVLGSL